MNKIMIAMGASLLLTTSAIAQDASTTNNPDYTVEQQMETTDVDTTNEVNSADNMNTDTNADANATTTLGGGPVDTTGTVGTAVTEPTVITDEAVDENEPVLIIRNNGDEECRIKRVSSESSSDDEGGFFANIFGNGNNETEATNAQVATNDTTVTTTHGVNDHTEVEQEYVLAAGQEHIIDTDLTDIFVVEASGELENGQHVPVTVDLGSCGKLELNAVVRN